MVEKVEMNTLGTHTSDIEHSLRAGSSLRVNFTVSSRSEAEKLTDTARQAQCQSLPQNQFSAELSMELLTKRCEPQQFSGKCICIPNLSAKKMYTSWRWLGQEQIIACEKNWHGIQFLKENNSYLNAAVHHQSQLGEAH